MVGDQKEISMRADLYLVEKGYVQSRQRARNLIESGCVTIDGKNVTKPAFAVSDGEHEIKVRDEIRYVGRGGLKLEAALDRFGLDVTGKFALDIGASTGGFTDCLLQRGASSVCAVDAGAGQLAASLVADPRVTSLEHKNARELTVEEIGGICADLIVMDVSFISATYILPQFPGLLHPNGDAVVLIKPQFEVGRAMLGKGGIVKEPRAHRYAVERVIEAGETLGLSAVGLMASPITGGDGNREFLIHFTHCGKSERRITEATLLQVTSARTSL